MTHSDHPLYAENSLTMPIAFISALSKEQCEVKMKEAYADYIWLQNEGRHKNDPSFFRLAIQVMDVMEALQKTIARKSGYVQGRSA